MRGLVRMMMVVGAAGVCMAGMAFGGRAAHAAASTTSPQAMVAKAADALVNSDPLGHINQSNPFGGLAYQDDALARSAQTFATSDPARSQRYQTAATAIADYLVQNDALESDGKIGWGLPSAWDAFGDGTTNPANQIYAFQTALVSWALLDTYAITQNSAYLAAVESAMANYAPSGTTSFGNGCQGCFMYWYSTNTNDAGRYVKNTNVLMGQVEADLFRITGDPQYQTVATAIYNEETYEVVQHGDYAYLGIDDPKYNPAVAPEAHIVLETFGYSQTAALLGLSGSQTQAAFDSMVTAFWNCGSRCLAAPITSPGTATTLYAQFMGCYPAAFDPTLATTCERMLSAFDLTNLLPFPLVGLLYALPSLVSAPAVSTPSHLRRTPRGPRPLPTASEPRRPRAPSAPIAP